MRGGKIKYPWNDGVVCAVFAATGEFVQRQNVIQIAHRAETPRRRHASNVLLVAVFNSMSHRYVCTDNDATRAIIRATIAHARRIEYPTELHEWYADGSAAQRTHVNILEPRRAAQRKSLFMRVRHRANNLIRR